MNAFISAIVPAYNEERTLAEAVRRLLAAPAVSEIVVVDDASSDRTYEIAAGLAQVHDRIRVLKQPANRGKGAAVRAGIAASRGDVVLILDADNEYDAAEIPELVQPILSGVADAVYGSRFLVRKAARVLYFYHYLANQALTFISNLFTNLNLSDVQTGYKAFRGEIIRDMILTSRRFGFEIEVTAKLAKLHCAIYEVPISYYARTYTEGKKIRAKDAFAGLWFIFRYNLFCDLKHSFRSLRGD